MGICSVETCRELGVQFHLEDAPPQISAFISSNVPVIIYDREYNRHLEGVRIKNWPEYAAMVLSLNF